MNYIFGQGNNNEKTFFGNYLSTELKTKLGINLNNGWFLSSCSYHCNRWNLKINGVSIAQTMYNWYYRTSNNSSNYRIENIVNFENRVC